MFASPCIGTVNGEPIFEAAAASFVMAELFFSFMIEYLGHSVITRRRRSTLEHNTDTEPGKPGNGSEGASSAYDEVTKLNVLVMEAGIVFHSVIIGVTTVVSGDSGFVALFIVVIFHQMFEGLALGTRITELRASVSLWSKLLMALLFTIITPLGMAIGIGTLDIFNGNDSATLWPLGILNAISAGILLWVGLVELLAHEWFHGALQVASTIKCVMGIVAFFAGAALMSFLGKWT